MIKLVAKSKELNSELEKLYNQVGRELEEGKDIVEKYIGTRPSGLVTTNVFGYDYIIKSSLLYFDKEITSPHLKFQSKEKEGNFGYKLMKSHKEGRRINKEFEKFKGISDVTLVPYGVHTWNGYAYGGFSLEKDEDTNIYSLYLSSSCIDVISLISKHYEIQNNIGN